MDCPRSNRDAAEGYCLNSGPFGGQAEYFSRCNIEDETRFDILDNALETLLFKFEMGKNWGRHRYSLIKKRVCCHKKTLFDA